MRNVTIVFGAILIVLGLVGYVCTGRESPTALIPVAFGIVFAVLGVLAGEERRRKHAMHAAAALSLLGFLGTAGGLPGVYGLITGASVERPAAKVAQSIMALLCLVFVGLCVRSFINARRQSPAR